METIDWGYVFSTLLIRFFGVFVVLGILEVTMILSSKIIRSLGLDQPAKNEKR
jgi:hypothetical protein